MYRVTIFSTLLASIYILSSHPICFFLNTILRADFLGSVDIIFHQDSPTVYLGRLVYGRLPWIKAFFTYVNFLKKPSDSL